MIKVFNSDDKTYETNGNVVLNPTYANIHKEDNGDYYLDLETSIEEDKIKHIEHEEGTTIETTGTTLTDVDTTKEHKFISLYGETQQASEPTPSSPQEIHNVSGDNTIEICGKNLFDLSSATFTNERGTSITKNSDNIVITTNNNYARCYTTINTKVGQQYTLSCNFTNANSQSIKIVVYEETRTTTLGESNTTTNTTGNLYVTFTATTTTSFVRIYGNTLSTSVSGSVTFSDIQLEKGEVETPIYETYTGNSQLISLGVENLFDGEIELGSISPNDGTTSSSTTRTRSKNYIKVKPNTTYYYTHEVGGNRWIVGYKSDKTGITDGNYSNYASALMMSDSSVLKFSFTTSATTEYIKWYDTNCTDLTEKITITIGSKEQHISTTPIELCKIGNYEDEFFKNTIDSEYYDSTLEQDKWYLKKRIGKVVLNGSENWIEQAQTGFYRYGLAMSNIINSSSLADVVAILSNQFKGISFNNRVSDTTNSIYIVSNGLTSHELYINTTTLTTLNGFKTYLSTNNVDAYYVLATPTNTEITDTTLIGQLNNLEKMKLYNGITNISITPNDLTPTLKLHYNYMTGGDVFINNNDYIKSNNIIVANTPTGEQAFRITDIEKRKHKIVLKAWHISYDTKNYVIQDSYVVDKTCNQAMDHLNNATDNTSPFTTTSDIAIINSYRCVRRSLFEAFNVVLERWGGHFVRDNWNFKIMNSIGQDNGVVVRYAKNLKDIQVTYDWTNVVTKILPVGNDGLLLDEVFLYADIQYDIPYTKVVHFAQNINENDYRDEQGILDEDAYLEALKNDLRSQATLYLQENYLPQVNYSLNANLEKITDIGDTIQVKDERLGVDITTNLISYDYDCILEKYTNLEFGNFTKTISDLTSYINSQTSQIVDESLSTTRITLENELETATSQIWGVLGSSYVLNEGDKILIVDSLPKETATNVIMINSAGIGFSQTGINGTFSTALTIDGTFNTSNVNVINFTADLIKGGVLKLGSNLNQNGILEVYDEANNLIAVLNKDGLRMNAVNGAYVLINQQVGFAGYDKNDNPIYWVSEDEFHMKKSVVEEEITLVDKMRIIPITITDNGTITNDGIGFVSTL